MHTSDAAHTPRLTAVKLVLLGASGLVGRSVLQLALAHPVITQVMAPTRQPLAPSARLQNPVGGNLEALVPDLMAQRPDAVICALGTTRAKAGSAQAFRHVDYELPLMAARAAQAATVETFAIVTAMGASETSPFLYPRTKGAVESAIRGIGFRSLTICRPSLLDGDRQESRTVEALALKLFRRLGPLLPHTWQVNPAPNIAAALLDAVLAARPGCRWIHSQEMTGIARPQTPSRP